MLLLKIILSSLIITTLALVAQRISSRAAGILSALPMGTALVLFFYGVEYGPHYVEKASVFNILGLSASLSFVIFYYLGSTLFTSPFRSVISAIFLSFSAYTIVALSLSQLTPNDFILPSAILLSVIAGAYFLFKYIPLTHVKVTKQVSVFKLFLRSLIATGFVIIISFTPQYLSASLAGIFSSFPSVIVPLLLILHLSFGRESVCEAVKAMPLSYVSVMIYSISVGESYLNFGIYWGTLISFSIALIYIISLFVISNYLASKRDTQLSPQPEVKR